MSSFGHEFFDPIHCEICELWLNGEMQWEDHQIGKKHKKNRRKTGRNPTLSDCRQFDPPFHPKILESLIVSRSFATDEMDGVRRRLPKNALDNAAQRQHEFKRRRRRRRTCRNKFALRIAIADLEDKQQMGKISQECAMCGVAKAIVGKLKRCSGCYMTSYCSTDCQRLHWQKHKQECRHKAARLGPDILLPMSTGTEHSGCLQSSSSQSATSTVSPDKSGGTASQGLCQIMATDESDDDCWTLISESSMEALDELLAPEPDSD